MNKEESLAFLQKCIEKVKNATEQDIKFYKDVYNRECVPVEKASEFEFVFPSNDIGCEYEINDEYELDVCNQDTTNNKEEMEYNFLGTDSFNQETSDNLPYAA